MDPAYIKKVLGNDLKKESNHLIHKSRNLMNPNKKKGNV